MSFSFSTPAAKPPVTGFGAPAPSLFGASPSLFGQPPAAQPPPGGLFGQPAPTTPATTSLFASTPATTSLFASTPAAPAGGLFGAPAPSLFGSTAPSSFGAPPPAATSLFGAQPATTSLFAPPAAASPFGQAQPSPFGQSQSAASASLFGSKPTSSLFPSSSAPQPTPQTVPKLGDPHPPLDPNEKSIESRIEELKSCWDPTTLNCKFQTYFYNSPTPPNTVSSYKQCPPGADPKAWAKAVRENPDPERYAFLHSRLESEDLADSKTSSDSLVPAIALGFPALQKRIDAQASQTAAHESTLTEIHDHLAALSSTHSLTTSLRSLRAAHTAAALSSRLSALVGKVSALSPNRNSSVRKEEEVLRVNLESMDGEAEAVREGVNSLWSGVGALRSRQGEQVEWAVSDDEGMRKILEILGSQQAGLDHLTKVLNDAADDVGVMNQAFGIKSLGSSRS